MKPTKAQIKALLGWCGYYGSIPNIDSPGFMGFLFKYVVPSLENWTMGAYGDGTTYVVAFRHNRRTTPEISNEDPIRALFWAAYEVLK